MWVERDADNFQVRFQFQESWFFNLEGIYLIEVFDVLIDDE